MSALTLVLWGFLAIIGSGALAFVVGLVNPQEKVNGLWLVVAAACIYVLAFRFYGRWISRRVVELNDQRVPPANYLIRGRRSSGWYDLTDLVA
jgi:carbon starvation protein